MPTRSMSQGLRPEPLSAGRTSSAALLVLQPLNGTFDRKQISVPLFPEVHKIGRQTNQRTVPAVSNAYFDSKVLSRQHAEIWADKASRVWIRDVKSSNGTFVNGTRLSPENKESDPHELRESDTLELGIDIISEDQKSVLHHKVAAKVEVAGSYADSPVLGMMPYDSGAGFHGADDFRGHSLPSLTNGSGPLNAVGALKPMNKWMDPITIEQVAHKLALEFKEAKRQSYNLRRTDLYLRSMLEPAHEEEKPTKAAEIKTNDVSTEAKPGLLQRVDTERPNTQDGQVLTLLEALRFAKQEISVQGNRMKDLEASLKKERRARELAERRAQALAGMQAKHQQDSETYASSDEDAVWQDISNHELHSQSSMDTVRDVPESSSIDTLSLQNRLDLLLEEMRGLKDTAERYKRRAEESEAAQQRWASTVEKLRESPDPTSSDIKLETNGTIESVSPVNPNASRRADRKTIKLQQELEKTLSSMLHHHDSGPHTDGHRVMQSAPYISMLGVVLLGVGLMTWLNGRPPLSSNDT